MNASDSPSLHNYYAEASYQQMDLKTKIYPQPQGDVILSYQDSHPRNYYAEQTIDNPIGYSNDEEGWNRLYVMLTAAIQALESQIPEDIDFDSDNNGTMDNVVFFLPGTTGPWATPIWPHAGSFPGNAHIHGKLVESYNLQVESYIDSNELGVYVFSHEMGHSFGMPDLYHYNYDGFTPVGGWDPMEWSWGYPSYMTSYLKYRYLNWIPTIPIIAQSGTYTLKPSSSPTNNCYKILSANSRDCYVLEFRKKIGFYEGNIPASGLLVSRACMNSIGNGERASSTSSRRSRFIK